MSAPQWLTRLGCGVCSVTLGLGISLATGLLPQSGQRYSVNTATLEFGRSALIRLAVPLSTKPWSGVSNDLGLATPRKRR